MHPSRNGGHAKSIITVSVAEGFGLGFLEPWTFGKGLCGRNLPEITSDFAELEFPSSNLYDRLPIPLDCISSISSLRLKDSSSLPLNNFIQVTKQDLPENGTEIAYQSMVENMIDFGRLDEINQQAIIRPLPICRLTAKNSKTRRTTSLDEQVIDLIGTQ